MEKKGPTGVRRKWFEAIPHPVILLFIMLVFAALLSYLVPAGMYERETVDGRQRVVPGSFSFVDNDPVGLMGLFTALPEGFKVASDIIFIVLISGIMFGVLEKSQMVENVIGTLVKKLGKNSKETVVVLMTFVFGLLGVAVGYENNIAMVPIAAVLAIALGGDLILAAGLSVAAITVGFGLSPINAYTVGTGHQIAELPLFSGALLRSILCFVGLAVVALFNVRYLRMITKNPDASLGRDLDQEGLELKQPIHTYQIGRQDYMVLLTFIGGMAWMLYGVFTYHWYLREIAAVFGIISVVAAIVARISPNDFGKTLLKSVAMAAPGAFMVGYATTIKVILEQGQISDSIAYYLSSFLSQFPTYGAAVLMTLGQSAMNFMVPSGSGQALATLPILIPVGELVGITRQSSILAFQIGDGVTNLVNPTLGGLIAMLSLCRVPFDRWLRFILPIAAIIMVMAWLILIISVAIHWGPA